MLDLSSADPTAAVAAWVRRIRSRNRQSDTLTALLVLASLYCASIVALEAFCRLVCASSQSLEGSERRVGRPLGEANVTSAPASFKKT